MPRRSARHRGCTRRRRRVRRGPRNWRIGSPVSPSQIRTVPSHPVDASSRPAGWKATPRARSTCPRNVWTRRPVATSQIRTVPFRFVEAIRRPSGRIARPWTISTPTDGTCSSCPPPKARTSRPVAASQIRIRLSQQAEAMVDPSGEHATRETHPECGSARAGSAAVPSQIFTVPSSLADAIDRPSGLKATLTTNPLCPRNTPMSSPVVASQSRTV